MIFEFVNLPELNFDLKSATTEAGRKYVSPEGNYYSSVTTVLSDYNKKAIMEWRKRVGDKEANRISSQASRRGTSLHSVCEKYLLNEMSEMKMKTMMPNIKELFFSIKNELDNNIGKIYSLEQALYSDSMKVAGRVDCIAEWNGKLSVIDFKSSSKIKKKENIKNYFMQCTAYSLMFQELTGRSIDQIVVVIAVENGEKQIFIENPNNYLNDWYEMLQNHLNKRELQSDEESV